MIRRKQGGEGKVIDKLFTGEWKYYHQASKIVMTLENYKNGKLGLICLLSKRKNRRRN
jgi:hypothetical protein